MTKFCIWRVENINDPFDTLDKAVAEATRIVGDEEREVVVVMKLMRRVKRRKPRVEVVIEKCD